VLSFVVGTLFGVPLLSSLSVNVSLVSSGHLTLFKFIYIIN
jgi:hypothetical protein